MPLSTPYTCKAYVLAAFLGATAGLVGANGSTDGSQFVMVSQPRLAKVVYLKHNLFTHAMDSTAYPLVTAGLTKPLGLAFDRQRQHLFVADAESQKVFMYKLVVDQGNLVTDGLQYVAMSGFVPRWVAVDGAGTLYASNEAHSQILKVTLPDIEKSNSVAEVVYQGSEEMPGVSSPGGVAVDGARVFWGNKAEGNTVGSVVKGGVLPDPTNPDASVSALAKNTPTAIGVCADQNNVFYSTTDKFLYGVKKKATIDAPSAVTVADTLTSPRGCAWDGDGTVYVADKGGNALFAFPCEMQTLGIADMKNLVTIEDPFGIAVYAGRPLRPGGSFLWSGAWRSSVALSFALVTILLLIT